MHCCVNLECNFICHFQGFYTVTENHSFEEGGKSCLTLAGLGKLAPNMLLIGFKSNWSKDLDNAGQYFNILEVGWEVDVGNS